MGARICLYVRTSIGATPVSENDCREPSGAVQACRHGGKDYGLETYDSVGSLPKTNIINIGVNIIYAGPCD